MNISCVLGKDLETYLAKFNDMMVNYDRFSPGIFKGFEGFSPIDVVEDKCQFIIATTEDNEVVGVIKFKRYKSSNHDFLSEEDFLACELLPPPNHLWRFEVGASLFYPICNNQSCQIVYSTVGHKNHL